MQKRGSHSCCFRSAAASALRHFLCFVPSAGRSASACTGALAKDARKVLIERWRSDDFLLKIGRSSADFQYCVSICALYGVFAWTISSKEPGPLTASLSIFVAAACAGTISSARLAASKPPDFGRVGTPAGAEIVMVLSLALSWEGAGAVGSGRTAADLSPNNHGFAMADWRAALTSA